MPLYIISYEPKKTRAHYMDFFEELKSYDDGHQILEGAWAVISDQTAVEIRDHLWRLLDPDDGIFVSESSGEAAWQDVRCENQWLRDHL